MKMQLLEAKIQKEQKGMILGLSDDLVMGGSKKEKGSTFSPIPHKDLVEAFQRLKPALIKTLKLDWVFNALQPDMFTTPEQHNANKVLSDLIWAAYDKAVASVTVTGFSISGQENNKGIKVSGTIVVEGTPCGFSSKRIQFNSDALGIEEALEKDLKKCISEVHAYIGGKHGEDENPNLFNQPTEPEDNELSQAELEKRRDEAIENRDNGSIETPHGKVKATPKQRGYKRSSPLKKAK